MELLIKKLHPKAIVPDYAHEHDAGMDLYSVADINIAPGERVKIPTGIAVAIPEGCVGLIWDKSGLATKYGLTTIAGVIDSGYRGEIIVGLLNTGSEVAKIEAGHKITQMLIQPVVIPQVTEVDVLPGSHRGENGFGSSGK